MDVETIAHERRGSFLYTGCYRARGELTRADRAAWGLREPFARHLEHHLNAAPRSAGSLPIFMTRVHNRGRLTVAATRPPYSGPHSCADDAGSPRFGAADAAAKQKLLRRLPVARTEPRPAHRWLRFRVKVEGERVTCLVLGERAFVTGTIVTGRQGCP